MQDWNQKKNCQTVLTKLKKSQPWELLRITFRMGTDFSNLLEKYGLELEICDCKMKRYTQ